MCFQKHQQVSSLENWICLIHYHDLLVSHYESQAFLLVKEKSLGVSTLQMHLLILNIPGQIGYTFERVCICVYCSQCMLGDCLKLRLNGTVTITGIERLKMMSKGFFLDNFKSKKKNLYSWLFCQQLWRLNIEHLNVEDFRCFCQ